MTRRTVLAMGSTVLSGCVSRPETAVFEPAAPKIAPFYLQMYSALDDESHPVQAVDLTQVDPKFWRREVSYSTAERPGTVIVDPGERYAYLVMDGGQAIRYGVGVVKEVASTFRDLPRSGERRNGRFGRQRKI